MQNSMFNNLNAEAYLSGAQIIPTFLPEQMQTLLSLQKVVLIAKTFVWLLSSDDKNFIYVLWCPIKVRVFHQNESYLSCPHPPLSYEGRREHKASSHFDEKLSF